MSYEQPVFPEDPKLPREIWGTPIGYVVDPKFIPRPEDTPIMQTNAEYSLGQLRPLFNSGSQGAVVKPGYETVPAVPQALEVEAPEVPAGPSPYEAPVVEPVAEPTAEENSEEPELIGFSHDEVEGTTVAESLSALSQVITSSDTGDSE